MKTCFSPVHLYIRRYQHRLITAAIISALTCSLPTFAQTAPDNSIGINLGIMPRYEGANSYRVLPLPELSFTHDNFFIHGLDAGVVYQILPGWSAGLLVTAGLGRKESDAAVLSGTGDIAPSLQAGGFVRWQDGPITVDTKFLQSLHSGYGSHITVGATYAIVHTSADRLTIGADAVWSSKDAMQTYFGIDSQQAASSTENLQQYHPSAGFSRTDAMLSWEHRLNPVWSVRSTLGVQSLIGDAADSPVVERTRNAFGSLGLAYHF